ncbi:Fur family transcriptional regulator [Chloroflexota bacterium]
MASPINRGTLTKAGMRVTSQRALILEIIRRGRGHLDADEIYRRAREREPRISLSTVYRTLQMFKKLGLVEELHFDETHHFYEVKPSTEHHHLVCLGCGRVIEFQYPLSQHVKKNVAEAKDFEVVGAEVRLTGYCPECQQKQG